MSSFGDDSPEHKMDGHSAAFSNIAPSPPPSPPSHHSQESSIPDEESQSSSSASDSDESLSERHIWQRNVTRRGGSAAVGEYGGIQQNQHGHSMEQQDYYGGSNHCGNHNGNSADTENHDANDPDNNSNAPSFHVMPKTLQDFEFGQMLGSGAFGIVRLCQERNTKRQYAAKIIKKATLIKAKQTKYVKTEKELLMAIDHPNVCKLYATFSDEKRLYFIMELVAGGELFPRLRKRETLPFETVQFLVAELVDAIAAIHAKNIVHRDLKPENLLLSSNGRLKLVDFGIAKVIHDSGLHTFCGTAEYLAPELVSNNPYGKSVDWWALGCIVYEMICGNSPFFSSSVALTCQKIVDRDVYWPTDMDPVVRDFIEGLLTVDVDKRLGSGEEDGDEVKRHSFFDGMNFDLLHQMKPPIIPRDEDADSGSGPKFENAFGESIPEDRQISMHYFDASGENIKDVVRRSEMLRSMYPELKKIPLRPAPLRTEEFSIHMSVEAEDIDATAEEIDSDPNMKHKSRTKLRLLPNDIKNFITPIQHIQWSPDGTKLGVSGNFFLHCFDFDHRPHDHSIQFDNVTELETGSSANYMKFSSDSEYLAYDLQRHINVLKKRPKKSAVKIKQLVGHIYPIKMIDWSSDSNHLISGGSGAKLYLWNVKQSKMTYKFKTHFNYITSLQWQKQSLGGLIGSGGGDSRLHFYDVDSMRVVQKIDYHENVICSLDFSPTFNIVASSAMDRKMAIMDINSFKLVKVFAHPTPVQLLQWSPDGSHLATLSNNFVRVFNFPDLKLVASIPREGTVNGKLLKFDSSGSKLAFVRQADDVLPSVYDLRTHSFMPIQSSAQHPHKEPITALRWHPTDSILATGGFDRCVKFWHCHSG
mmetsp:Transcript_3792/g.14401  ORF Transcript_3792/g.14401 Transcript_3792/m.14401 type:complete len:870 (-) Transcript_3792:2149-4758(-)|eukprot:CAMPEP_0117445384 /NCGR_PEP_ID=MMETSP0759-20121206/5766_1 /TAXON_ID=63605 /ORGANISM="Percolomonas cosmopolitus, Strain WS" /LENGTH=869 /DNA_ID=CAMNT_0005237555 /DNA_START=217 /DNA_END=2826 /DNA_ORIENTATION=+